tara:strand:- start:410 stop:562 length:153 start_codon:yes stop_codon:yes gene_type:complete
MKKLNIRKFTHYVIIGYGFTLATVTIASAMYLLAGIVFGFIDSPTFGIYS